MGARRMPAAEVDVTPDLVRRLLAAQQPDLADLPVEELAHGWDNVMCRVGGELVARLPRRELAVGLLANEQRWLPLLQPPLLQPPLPIPAPVRIGRPGLGYPWSWSIVPFVPGQVACRNPPADPAGPAVVPRKDTGGKSVRSTGRSRPSWSVFGVPSPWRPQP